MESIDMVLKVLEILVFPLIFALYMELKEMRKSINGLNVTVGGLVPIQQFTDLDKKVSILENSYHATISRILSDLEEIKNAIHTERHHAR